MNPHAQPFDPSPPASAWQVFRAFLALGVSAFGGPVAHLAHFRDAFVVRRRWLSEHDYADLVALCQFLPGPASSQVGMALGLMQAGYRGALAAWLGFTLPSAVALTALAMGLSAWTSPWAQGALTGLKAVAVPIVAQAVWGMSRSLCPDALRRGMALGVGVILLCWPGGWTPWLALLGSGAMAMLAWRLKVWAPAGPTRTMGDGPQQAQAMPRHVPRRRTGLLWLALFLAGLLALPWLGRHGDAWALANAFYRAGALVFGGGHVVLPLLQAELVPTGWIDNTAFLAGYGAAQAVPGPLFTLAAFLGASASIGPGGWLGGLLALVAIFVPAFMVLAAALPWWLQLRQHTVALVLVAGVNAGVVGLLGATLIHPVATSTLTSPLGLLIALGGGVAWLAWRWPVWCVVVASAVAGMLADGLMG